MHSVARRQIHVPLLRRLWIIKIAPTSVAMHAARARRLAAGRAPSTPCTFLSHELPRRPVRHRLFSTGRPICRAHALTGRHLQPICPELPIASPNNTMVEPDSRPVLCGISTRKLLQEKWSRQVRHAGRYSSCRVPFWPDSSVRSKPPRVRGLRCRRVGAGGLPSSRIAPGPSFGLCSSNRIIAYGPDE